MPRFKRWTILFFILTFNLAGRVGFTGEANAQVIMKGVLDDYLAIQEKLASDTTAGVEAEAQGISKKISVFFKQPCRPDEIACASVLQKISEAASKMKGGDIQSLRKNFQELSEGMMKYWTDFKPDWPEVFAFRCSMANDNKGAPWLQKGSELKNPYFGKAMSGCGTLLNK